MTTTATEPLKLAKGAALHRLVIELDVICPSPSQPRKHFDEAGLAELAESIKKHGVLEPILLRAWPSAYTQQPNPRPHYELVAGERRWRAAKLAGLTAIEAKILELDDKAMLEIQVIENLQRQDLTALEEADGYHRMVTDYHYKAEEIAEKIGKSKSHVYARLKLATLCHEGRKTFAAGKLDASKALLIARIPTAELQQQALLEITSPDYSGDTMSYRRAAEHVQKKYMLLLTDAPFPPNDPDLVATAGTCKLCPKRSGNAGDLFNDVKNANVCTDLGCYESKRKAAVERLRKEAEAAGRRVITGEEAKKLLPYGRDSYAEEVTPLDKPCYQDKQNRTYRELIAEQQVPVTMVEDVKNGGLIETVENKVLAEALKAAGVKVPAPAAPRKTEAEIAEEKKEKDAKLARADAFRGQLFDQVRTSIRADLAKDPSLEPEELAMIAAAFFTSETVYDAIPDLIALWNPDFDATAYDDLPYEEQKKIEEDFTSTFRTWSRSDLLLLLLDMTLIGERTASPWQAEEDEQPEKLLELAKNCGIDAAAIKKQVEAKERAKAKSEEKAKDSPKPTKAKGKAKSAAPAAADESKPTAGKVAQAPDTATPTLKVQPSAATFPAGSLQIGMHVRIKNNLKGPGGHLRKCCGREGVIEDLPGDGAWVTVRLGPKKTDLVTNLAWNEVEIQTTPAEATRPGAEAKVGDQIVILAGALNDKGKKLKCCGYHGRVNAIVGDVAVVKMEPASPDVFADVPLKHVKVLSAAPSGVASTPTKAAPAAGVKAAKKPEQPAPAVAKPALDPRAAWPFPTRNNPVPTVAAQAGESKGEEKSSGLAAERKPAKSQKVTNAKPTGERPVEAGAEVARRDKTADMFGAGK
jgi:ParB/RepB/Spo0J family partition protein